MRFGHLVGQKDDVSTGGAFFQRDKGAAYLRAELTDCVDGERRHVGKGRATNHPNLFSDHVDLKENRPIYERGGGIDAFPKGSS